jgi:hypothetical protein
MVAHGAGGEFGPSIFPQDRELNRGWSNEGKRYRALEREIAATPGTFFFCCLLYRDDSDSRLPSSWGCSLSAQITPCRGARRGDRGIAHAA